MLFAGLGSVRIVKTVTSSKKILISSGLGQHYQDLLLSHYTDLPAGK